MMIDYDRVLRRMIGYGLMGLLSFLVLLFCAYVKSWWDEPLGGDGLLLWFVLMLPLNRVFPAIQRLMSGAGSDASK